MKNIFNVRNNIVVSLLGIMLGACNGGGTQSNSTQQSINEAVIAAPAPSKSSEQFVKNSCINGVFAVDGSLALSNTCHSAQSLAQANLKFVAQDTSGDAITLGKFYNKASGLEIEFSSGGANQQIGSFVSVDKPLLINADKTLIFSGLINQTDRESFDYSWANKTLSVVSLGDATIDGVSLGNETGELQALSQPNSGAEKSLLATTVVKSGTLSLKINTVAAGCGVWTDCSNLTAQVNNATGSAVGSVTVPAEFFGKTYSATIPNLAPGNYTVTLSTVNNTSVLSSNPDPVIKSNDNTTDEITYTTTMGSAKVTVDTSKASCGSSANCSGLVVSLVNPIDGTVVASFNVPDSAFGKEYSKTLDGIPAGEYKVVGSPIANTKISYSEDNGAINIEAQETGEQVVTYVTSITTGNASISLGTLLKNQNINLPVTIINTKNDNNVVYSGTISQGSTVNVSGLEQTGSDSSYKVCLPVGYADPMQAKYFMQTSCQNLTITKLKTTNLKLSMRTNPVTLYKMNLQISGVLAGDTAVANFSDSVNKYIYAPLSVDSNGSTVAYFEKNSNLVISTVATVNTAVYSINPVNMLLKITAAGAIQIPFSSAMIGAQLDLATSYDYANNWLTYIPVGQFGLISYVVTNSTDEVLSEMIFPELSSYPDDVTMDVTRTTCFCPTCSPVRSVSSLEPGQSCTVVFKYQPTTYDVSSSFNYSMTFVGETSKKTLATPIISMPFSSRSIEGI